jgi:DNA replication ATP-dependent helicase Dna2
MIKSPARDLYNQIEAASRLNDLSSQVREIRVILETLFHKLTKSETRSFSNIFGRMTFVFDKMMVKQNMQDQLNELRRFCNKIAHDSVPVSLEEGMVCIRVIAEAIEYFYEVKVPADLSTIYTPLGERRFTIVKTKPKEQIAIMQAVVIRVEAVQKATDGSEYFVVKCREDEIGEFNLQLWNSMHNNLTSLQPLLCPYDNILILKFRKHPDKNNFYTSEKETQIILEPDILIDITELAECFQSKGAYPILALLKKLVPADYAKAAFQGNMVNAILDAAVRDDSPDFKEAFKDAVADNVFQAAAYGKDTLNEIYKNIRDAHWANVVHVAEQYRNKPTRIEPTFFSSTYGLQGRLDLLVEDLGDPTRKEIVELKSGKAPDTNAWRNNEMQVVGYNLLLKSTFGKHRHGPSGILYSAAKFNPLRDVVSNSINENRLLLLRNEVIHNFLQIAQAKMDVLSQINSVRLQDLPNFRLKDVIAFETMYGSAESLEKSYYQHFLCFTIRQWLHEKCGMYTHPDRTEDGDGFAGLWRKSEAEKREQFNIIPDLSFSSFSGEKATVVFRMQDAMQQHNFRPGDTAILYRRIEEEPFAMGQQIIKGRVDQIRAGDLVFSLNNKQLDGSYFDCKASWLVEHDIFEKNYWVASESLLAVLDPHNKERFRLLMGLKAPERNVISNQASLIKDENLNDNQRQILAKALAAKDYFLIQGPPGTGKTSTLLPQLVNGLLQQTKGSILIVAFTNRAVEEIAGRLEQRGIDFMRLGGRGSKADQDLRQYCADGKIEQAREYIQKHKVFLATVTTMCSRIESLKQLKDDLDTLIVDEASQLTEPQLLSLVLDSKKFVLIGDQNQLPPVVAIHEGFCQVSDTNLQAAGVLDLRTALFERLFRQCRNNGWDHSIDMLTTHFRMHEDIASLINPWYGNQLQSGGAHQQDAVIHENDKVTDDSDERWHEILQTSRVIYLPSSRELVSKYHRQEASRVVSLLRFLRKRHGDDFNADKVGVVTPWRTQIGLIRSLIGDDEQLQQLNIDTVERFQGSENDIIIVSMAVYHPSQVQLLTSAGKYPFVNEDGELKEIDVDRKLLVTLSRARKQVVVMGYESALRSSNHYSNIINKIV